MELIPFDTRNFGKKKPEHSKTLHRNLCIPSVAQSYSLCVEYAKRWFLSLFDNNPFKSVYVDGGNIFDDWRRLSSVEILKRKRPALAIIPNMDMAFNNDNVDMYQFGTKLYTPRGLYSNSFYLDEDHSSYLGLIMETLFVEITYRIRLETKAQQLDMYKYLQMAARVGSTSGEDVDLDFHIPYDLIVAIAKDAGFELIYKDEEDKYPRVKNVQAFLAHLNTHSQIPFLYKMRAINGNNEFFIRMHRMYVHERSTDITADTGEREGVMNNNYTIELSAEFRFPAPKFYAYYTNNSNDFTTVFSTWRQPSGIVSAFYAFKGTDVPNENQYGWPKYLETTYEDEPSTVNKPLTIDMKELLSEGELGETIRHCLATGVSPSIFCDILVINGGEHPIGQMDWPNLVYQTTTPVRSTNSYIVLYIDMMFINDYMITNRDATENRLQPTQDPETLYAENPQKIKGIEQ